MKKSYLKVTAALLALLTLGFTACEDDDDNNKEEETNYYTLGTTTFTVDEDMGTVTIKDNGTGIGTKTLSADTTWILDGFVFVAEGQTLTIEAGTMIQGKPGQGENASAMIVNRGGVIEAEGTATAPIIFTGLGDTKDGTGYLTEVQGLWGGLIILGNATTNNPSTDKRVEGIPEDYNSLYGGTDDNDNSGTLKYVSIRHGGSDIGAGNEINGLTLAAVGSATTLDYIEVISNIDDGVEFFGGAPRLKHILVSYVGDDSYDYDEGFHGMGQFWVAMQGETSGDRLGEHDGGPSDNEVGEPYAKPTIYNATYIGRDGKSIIFRDNAGGTYANSIFATAGGLNVEYRDDKHNAFDMLSEGHLVLKNNIFNRIGDGTAEDALNIKEESGTAPDTAEDDLLAHFNDNNNEVASLEVGLIDDEYYFIPAASEAGNGVAPTNDWFDNVTYQGAFQPGGSNWAAGWTLSFGSSK